jgi:hypothetical protein
MSLGNSTIGPLVNGASAISIYAVVNADTLDNGSQR